MGRIFTGVLISLHCRICNNRANNTAYTAREMMLGLRETFAYFRCAACGCLQIAEFPADLAPYYPPGYFRPERSDRLSVPNWAYTLFDVPVVMQEVRRAVAPGGDALTNDRLAELLAGRVLRRYLPDWVERKDAAILDVGCARGGLIHALSRLGYARVQGVDLFIDAPVRYANGVEVHKGTIHDMPSGWDVIMLHHAFEHMPDPLATLQAIAQRLAPGGLCLIRIPVVPSLVWERYGVDWVQWDAPRHFFLHSQQSIALLADQAGLHVEMSFCDSTPFQFVGSEFYRRDMALTETGPQARFTPQEMAHFRAETARANAAGQGDQAAFYLRQAVGAEG